jgi:hypothetical protein
LRKQYFFRNSARGILAWDVDSLVAASSTFTPVRVPVSAIRELQQPWSGDGQAQTWNELIAHVRLIDVRFDEDPEPDFVGRGPDDLPY